MTPTPLTSPTAELIAYRDELVESLRKHGKSSRSEHTVELITEVLDELTRREASETETK